MAGRESPMRPVAVAAAMAAAMLAILAGPGAASADADGPPTLTRYSIVHGCFALRSEQTGNYVTKGGLGYTATAATVGAAEKFRMQATDLGRYLFYGPTPDFMGRTALDTIAPTTTPSDDTDWTVNEDGNVFRIVNEFADRDLAVGAGNALVAVPEGTGGAAGRFTLDTASGCAVYPEVDINVDGAPATRSPSYGEVRGYMDGHMHQMAFEFLGGDAHCGKPWDRFGAPYALQDCPDHQPNGCAAVLENVLYGSPARCHDPVGWPTFVDWPHPQSLTHEDSYYRWLERSWRGGQRIFVNLLVENRVLCEIYPIKHTNCDEMDSVRREAADMHALERYIDAQSGGPGKGWYRIVTDPFQAREVINSGKLAVIMGMEVSEPFGCRVINDVPQCTPDDVAAGVDELHALGVRQLELINKFDNALAGVAGDSGTTGTITNTGNFASTGKFWDLETCPEPVNHDHSPSSVHNVDQSLANGLAAFLPGGALPVYPAEPHCNQLGLSTLGDMAIRRIMSKGMIFDPDHMSVVARDAAMKIVESADYPGVISSHSWSTPNTLPRIFDLGGMVTPYAGNSQSFVDQWRELRSFRSHQKQYWGIGYGADMNGFGSQGDPRGATVSNPVTYPFKSFDGSATLDKQVSGQRVYDINVDGVAHYGLYPDWIQDLRMLAGDEIVDDMARGSEAYLEMWERASGVKAAECRSWPGRVKAGGIGTALRLGADPTTLLRTAGQPESRTTVWKYCGTDLRRAGKKGKKKRKGKRPAVAKRPIAVEFGSNDRAELILSTLRNHTARGIGPGTKAKTLPARARRLRGNIWVRSASKSNRYVFVVRKGRVSHVGVASSALAKASDLRSAVRRALAG